MRNEEREKKTAFQEESNHNMSSQQKDPERGSSVRDMNDTTRAGKSALHLHITTAFREEKQSPELAPTMRK